MAERIVAASSKAVPTMAMALPQTERHARRWHSWRWWLWAATPSHEVGTVSPGRVTVAGAAVHGIAGGVVATIPMRLHRNVVATGPRARVGTRTVLGGWVGLGELWFRLGCGRGCGCGQGRRWRSFRS